MLVIRMYCGADAFMESVRMSMLCKRRLLFLEAVRIKSAPCVLYRKIWMRVTRMTMRTMCHCKMRATCHCKMRAMCHCKMRATCSRREGSLQTTCIYIYIFDAYVRVNKWEINLSKQFNNLLTLVNLYGNFLYMQCPPIIEETDQESSCYWFCDLPWALSSMVTFIYNFYFIFKISTRSFKKKNCVI